MGSYEEAVAAIEHALEDKNLEFTRVDDRYSFDPSKKVTDFAWDLKKNGIDIGRGQRLETGIQFWFTSDEIVVQIVPKGYESLNFSLPSFDEITEYLRHRHTYIRKEDKFLVIDRIAVENKLVVDTIDTLIKMSGSTYEINGVPCILEVSVRFSATQVIIYVAAV